MALVTVSKIKEYPPHHPGGPTIKAWLCRINDNSYTAGGYTLPDLELDVVQWVDVQDIDTYLTPVYNSTTKKVEFRAPHNSSGVGGGQLNPASTVLQSKTIIVVAYGT